jgi:CRISPR-associated protein Csb1
VRASSLRDSAAKAFASYRDGDARPLAELAPTSLVFGAWDSRGDGAKLPRLVSSIVRASHVDVLRRAALYSPPTDYSAPDLLGPHNEDKAEKDARSALGFQHAPATWSSNDKIPEYREGRPNEERRILGGVIARGDITRDVTVNLVALRQLGGAADADLREYILSLALVAACDQQDGFFRQGCLLTLAPKSSSQWQAVNRNGARSDVTLDPDGVLKAATDAAKRFGIAEPRAFDFDPAQAREVIDEQIGGKKKKKGKSGESAAS